MFAKYTRSVKQSQHQQFKTAHSSDAGNCGCDRQILHDSQVGSRVGQHGVDSDGSQPGDLCQMEVTQSWTWIAQEESNKQHSGVAVPTFLF
jgi:hypothetical protein